MRKTVLGLLASASLAVSGCNVSTIPANITAFISQVKADCNLVLTVASATGLLGQFAIEAAAVKAACNLFPGSKLAAMMSEARVLEAAGKPPVEHCYGVVRTVQVCGYVVTPSQAAKYRHLLAR